MSGASGRQLHVPLDEQDARVADLAASLLDQSEAFLEQGLVPFAVGETGAKKKMAKLIFQYPVIRSSIA
jgi:hypothetical protein